ncbi:hypothetical protein ACN38_g11966 [Penicillium nordicum]|uniref:Uncharacterized protein n=1 Tax=Penicillium nordicum TaxID=229535 RepID=A0A0M8NRI3_9EURO|nr:hypothetical protein ACN38_g11966 [Penicillium nordicum]
MHKPSLSSTAWGVSPLYYAFLTIVLLLGCRRLPVIFIQCTGMLTKPRKEPKQTNRNSKSMHGAIHLLCNLGPRSLEIVHHLVFFFNPGSLPCRKTLRERLGRIEIYPEDPPLVPRDHHIPRLRITMKNPRKMNVLEYMTKFT